MTWTATARKKNTSSVHFIKTSPPDISIRFQTALALPPRSNERFGFRCIPLEGLHYSLAILERTDSPRGELAVRYLDLLERYLEDL